jgi:hypothetical protein
VQKLDIKTGAFVEEFKTDDAPFVFSVYQGIVYYSTELGSIMKAVNGENKVVALGAGTFTYLDVTAEDRIVTTSFDNVKIFEKGTLSKTISFDNEGVSFKGRFLYGDTLYVFFGNKIYKVSLSQKAIIGTIDLSNEVMPYVSTYELVNF